MGSLGETQITPNWVLILFPTMSLIQCNTEQSKPAIEKVESNPAIQPYCNVLLKCSIIIKTYEHWFYYYELHTIILLLCRRSTTMSAKGYHNFQIQNKRTFVYLV